MNLKPSLGKVLIKRSEPETKSGGIIIPETAQEKSTKGHVLAVGAFEKDKEFDIKTGDVAYFPKWGGTEIKDEAGDTYIVIKAEEILGVERK